MPLRHQLPAWSPVTLRSLAAGLFPATDALERLTERVRTEYGVGTVILTASGTVALALAIRASAPSGTRPRVALPAWACPDLMTAADTVDAEVLLYDLDPRTLSPDLDSLGRVLSRGPHAVVAVHWFGLPADLGPLRQIAAEAGARLIEDAAQGACGRTPEGPLGAFGDYGILSFGRGKGRTGGGGGALLASPAVGLDAALVAAERGLRSIAVLAAQGAFSRPWLYGVPASIPWLGLGETHYHAPPPIAGMHRRQAAALEPVWPVAEGEGERRRANAHRWAEALAGVSGADVYLCPAGLTPGWLRFPIRLADAIRGRFRSAGARQLGIMPAYPTTLDRLPVPAGRLLESSESLRGARELAQALFTLPTHRHVGVGDYLKTLRLFSNT
ncbi:MAG: DegT/DnrJ/EryC1/StrS aminotransferase family protein [Gemmatimonadales bacterium]|nr:DegT/DnrJ/EryC1/StrS aminotransferase family protein [Gemmatimonadales bacterium]